MELALNNPYNAPTADMTAPESSVGTYQPRVFAITGRIGRLRYFAYGMAWTVIAMIPYFIAMFSMGALAFVKSWAQYGFMVPTYIASIALTTRRVADLGHSRWFAALMAVPYVNIVPYLYFLFKAGDEEANQYGPPPCPNSRGVVAAAWIPAVISVVGIVAAVAIPIYMGVGGAGRHPTAASSKL